MLHDIVVNLHIQVQHHVKHTGNLLATYFVRHKSYSYVDKCGTSEYSICYVHSL